MACRAADEPGPAASNGDEAVDDAPSPPADSVVQADAAAETDNVIVLAFTVSQIQSQL